MAKYFITPIVLFLIAIAAVSFSIGNPYVFEWGESTREKIVVFTGVATLVLYFGFFIYTEKE